MKSLIVLVLAAALGASAASEPSLATIHKVYMMPMGSGLDQYLADSLTKGGVFTVVVDPKQADAVWSENVGPAFGAALDDLYKPKEPAPAAESSDKAKGKDQKDAKDQKDSKDQKADTAVAKKDEQPARRSAPRGRGTVFLVGVKNRQVLWSTYLNINDRTPRGLHRVADEVVKRLKKDLSGKE